MKTGSCLPTLQGIQTLNLTVTWRYEFKEDGNILESANKKFYGNVSIENPIVFEYPRKKDSTYDLEIKIEDKSGINLHKSEIKISPAAVESETN